MSPDRLSVLRCPENGSALMAAEAKLIDQLNGLVSARQLWNRAGRLVEKRLDGGLVRERRDLLYPIIDQIPVLLKDEAISLTLPTIGAGSS
jgi:uncharacterized protein YbaR (Trm112 family)